MSFLSNLLEFGKTALEVVGVTKAVSDIKENSGYKMEIALAKSLGLDIKFLRNRRGLANRN